MGKSVYTTVDFKVNPTVSDKVKWFVFVNELLSSVGELDVNIFGTVYKGLKLEFRNVEGDILGVFSG